MDKATCSINGCVKPARIKGLCGMHDQRQRRGQDMDAPPARIYGADLPYCVVPRCASRADARLPGAVCAKHRARMSRVGSYIISRVEAGQFVTCTVFLCDRPYKAAGLCNHHYVRSRKYQLSAMQMDQIARIRQCESCGGDLAFDGFQIDHDHACCDRDGSCGTCLRGVLCPGCNLGLGAFRDDPRRLLAAVAYLGGV